MKSTKKPYELEEMADSVMRWGSGEEVVAHIDWDSRWYYLWFDPTMNFVDWAEENPDIAYLLEELVDELAKLGVQQFSSLEGVNAFCAEHCGDNEPAYFYIDDVWNDVRGA